jgi:hypothetical protein
MNKQLLLVTGSPRSGTTVLGRMIAFSSEVNYIWEPFNNKYWDGIPDYYPYVGDGSDSEKAITYDSLINNVIHLINLKPKVSFNSGASKIKKIAKKYRINRSTFLWYRWAQIRNVVFNPRVLVCKDPIGIFLSEHLIRKFEFKVIAVIRHPAGVALSRKKLDWKFDFDWWRSQKDFYNVHFGKIDNIVKTHDLDFIRESSFHWLTCYSYLQEIKEKYPESVMIIRHEDLCVDAVQEMQEIFKYLGLTLNGRVVDKIQETTSGSQLERSTLNLAKLEKRDARSLVFKWRDEISQDELNVIREITEPVSSIYYGDVFWYV